MSFRYLLHLLVSQAKDIQKERGTIGLIKASIRFLYSPVYKHELYYFFKHPPMPEYDISEARPRISESKLNFKIVTSNTEADQLEKEGFSFRTHPTYFNHDLKLYTHWLDCGVIAFCTFVDKEFAAIIWIVTSQQTHSLIKSPPMKVDYSNQEVFPRGAWVNPKYRGLELYRYTIHQRDYYLRDKGIKTILEIVQNTNNAGNGLVGSAGTRRCGYAELKKFLWWTQWKEYLDTQTSNHPKSLHRPFRNPAY
jgi:hypothetical protein